MKVWEGKYAQAYIMSVKELMEYKFSFYIRGSKPLFQILILWLVWIAIFKATKQTSIGGLNMYSFITYIILAMFVKMSIQSWSVTHNVTMAIKEGNLASIITKPVDFVKLQLANIFAIISMTGWYSLILFFALSFILKGFFPGIFIQTNPFQLIMFFVSLILGILVSFMFYFIVGTSTFWFGDSWSITGTAIFIQGFFSGELFPLSISPTLLTLGDYLPFKSMIYTPISIYMGTQSMTSILIQAIWLIIMYVLVRVVVYYGIKQFEAQGG